MTGSAPDVPASPGKTAVLVVVDPSGNRLSVPVRVLPFRIGRHADSHLVMRDSRASRNHARIVVEGGGYFIEDLNSRHGTFVNGERVERRQLKHSDCIEFGSPDSYRLIFTLDGGEINRLLDQFPQTGQGAASNLAKLRAVMEVARALQTSLSTQDVLASVVDAALAVTGAERGFLLLRRADDLEMRVARDSRGMPLAETDLKVPRRLIQRALQQRRELLSMNFDAQAQEGVRPEHSVADLDLRSVVCVPLVRIRVSDAQETSILSTINDTVGVLYMDSRVGHADLSSGNRELLQTLALEASTVLENARLLEEERLKQKMEEELGVARRIQQSLLPRALPAAGWFRAKGSSLPSAEVGGDYFDVYEAGGAEWMVAVADVSGKGVSSALMASYLQGAFSAAAIHGMSRTMEIVNRFLVERSEGDKYATVFCGSISEGGRLAYVNAGHCAPLLVQPGGGLRQLEPTGVPVGLIPGVEFPAEEVQLGRGDKLVIFSDGVTEAQAPGAGFYGGDRLREVCLRHAAASCSALHDAILTSVREFIHDAPQADDITLLVVEYHAF
ncbi:MAG: SpoIIE family protein phosphatase [Bryobacterales bacterium]|nr:SpoIIE family protein phosphatase [Bryobacterales bacterium]